MFNSKRVIGFCVEEADWIGFVEKCNELGLTPSEVLREFVRAFSGAEVKSVERRINLSVNLNITKVEKPGESKGTSIVRQLLQEELLLELKQFINSTKRVLDTMNLMQLYDRKKYLMRLLKQLRGIPPETAVEVQGLLESLNERIAELRRA